MKRRDFVKMAAVTAAATATAVAQQAAAPATAPPPAATTAPATTPPAAPARGRNGGSRGGYQATPPPMSPATAVDLVATGDPHFFNHQQFATLSHLCALMMPPLNGFPSAVEAGVPEFLDFLVAATPAGRQQSYVATLADSAGAAGGHRLHRPARDVRGRIGAAQERGPAALLEALRLVECRPGQRTVSSGAGAVDGRSSAPGLIPTVCQRGAPGHPRRHHELVPPGTRRQ